MFQFCCNIQTDVRSFLKSLRQVQWALTVKVNGLFGVQRDDEFTSEGGVVFDPHFLEYLSGNADVT